MDLVRDLLRSKKARMALLGLLATVAVRYGLDPELIEEVAGIFIAYLLGQGVADAGKERAIVERAPTGRV